MARPGDYKHRVRIEVRTTEKNAEGERLDEWLTFAEVACAIQWMPGREVFEAQRKEGRNPVVFRVRASSQTRGMTPAMRLVLLSTHAVFDIQSVIPSPDRAELVITAEEHVGETAGPGGGDYIPPVFTVAADKVTVAPVDGLEARDAQAALAELAARVQDLTPLEEALAAEAESRAGADSALCSRIAANEDALAAEAATRANADAAEATTRAAADTALGGRVSANESSIASLLTQIAKAVLTSGDQSVDGIKTFLAQAVLQAGAALGAKLAISGVSAGGAAVEIEDGDVLGKHDSSALGANNRRWVNVWATGVNANLFRDLTQQNRFIFGGGGPNDYFSRVGTGTASPIAHRFGVSNGPMTNAAAMIAGFYLDNLATLKSQITKDGAYEVLGNGAYFAIARSTNGTRYGISVSNSGTVVATPL